MMKRKISQFLMLSLMVISVGFLGSCKDYDEDNYNALSHEISDQSTLIEALKSQVATLEANYEALKAAQEQCQANCKAKQEELAALIEQYKEELSKVQGNCNCNPDELQSQIDKLRSEYETKIKELNSTIADLQAADQSLENAIKEINTTLTDVKKDLADYGERIEKLEEASKANAEDIAALQKLLEDYSEVQKAAIDAAAQAQKAEELAEANSVQIGKNTEAIEDLQNQLNNLDVAALTEEINNLKDVINSLKNSIPSSCDCSAALAAAAAAQATANANKDWIENVEKNLNKSVEDLKNADKELANDLTDVKNSVTDLKEYVDSLAEVSAKNYQTAIALADKANDELKKELENELKVTVEDITNAYKAADQKLQDQIDDLVATTDDLQKQINKINDDIDALNLRVDAIKDALKKQITGIIVQGTENPVFGSFALPANVRSNVLVAFYGKSDDDIEFPTKSDGNYVWKSQVLTDAEADVIGNAMGSYTKKGNKTLVSSAANNAGTLYLTINPSNVDFSGVTLSLENSNEKSAGMTLSALEASDETLTFGYTRAAGNGFYETNAKVTANDIDNSKIQKIDFDKSGFKDIASDFVHNPSSFNITSAIKTVYDQFNGVLDANGVVATATDTELGETKVTSNYCVAATAVKPLSYAFLNNYYGRSTLPGYEKAESFIDRITNKVKDVINDNWPNLTIDNLEIKNINPKDFTVEFAIRIATDGVNSRAYKEKIGDLNYIVVESKTYDTGGNEKWQETVKIALNDDDAVALEKGTAYTQDGHNCNTVWDLDIKKNIDGVDDIYSQINGSLDDIDDFLDDVNDMLDDINGMQTSIENVTDDLNTYLQKFLDKLNSKGISYVNSAITRMLPCVLVETTSDGMRMGYNTPSNPMSISTNDVTLVLTSYTGEILTPAFKKHVACVDAIKNGVSDKSEAKRVNSANASANLNTVIDGTEKSVHVTGLKSGYTYQFAYSAVDFFGKMSTKRCTVYVK